ncbi:transcriptional regulator [Psychrosphaera saromensis]|uniref:DUF1315 domain-containing protein n=1 Tax=Psychrosphaera saromensis TaxID=716813 RepID=A0A2S7UY31_9GAMM|nr:DUF1315 family protein [Psychrosphaera saromensis]PQJ54170.1 hypothetical protein BTO11_11255 [Psychrosphaera saromensis]GHB75401.1 transcriptional regulator [Psychrosphaera saromensis]GLQ12737.1 transcriptional regulator [Psychrosphaera saromensis]
MNLEQMLATVTPEVFENLKYAVETGKWQNGQRLTTEQRENSLQLVLAYQAKVEKSNQQFTIGEDGEMVMKSKRELQREFLPETDIARFNQDDI